MKKHRTLIFIVLSLAFIAFAGFTLVPQELKKNIEAGKAKSVKTDITFPAGKLYISPNANALCEGLYKYRRDLWKPDISYNEDSEKGYLKIEAFDNRDERKYDDSDQTEWIISFNRNIRNEMKIEMIAGESNIDLQSCKLDRFEFEMVAGESHINLRNSSVPYFEFKAVAGEAEIDLSGEWKNDLDGEIKGGVGELTITLPSDIGIKLNISGGLGEVHAPAFDKHNREYTNELYGKTKSSLYLDITGGIGTVNVRVIE
jgi:hypothetical protein